MEPELREVVMNCHRRAVQQRGVVTLPKEWREEHGVDEGSEILLHETDDGTLEIVPTDA